MAWIVALCNLQEHQGLQQTEEEWPRQVTRRNAQDNQQLLHKHLS